MLNGVVKGRDPLLRDVVLVEKTKIGAGKTLFVGVAGKGPWGHSLALCQAKLWCFGWLSHSLIYLIRQFVTDVTIF